MSLPDLFFIAEAHKSCLSLSIAGHLQGNINMKYADGDDCGEDLKGQLQALRQKYGGDCVSFMNRVCELEEMNHTDRPQPDQYQRGYRLDRNGPNSLQNINRLALLYVSLTFQMHHPFHLMDENAPVVEGEGHVDNTCNGGPSFELRPLLWMLRKQRKLKGARDFSWIIAETTPAWTNILTASLPDDIMCRTIVRCDTSQSSFENLARHAFLFHLCISSHGDPRSWPFLGEVIRTNRAVGLEIGFGNFEAGWLRENVVQPMQLLQSTISSPRLENVDLGTYTGEDPSRVVEIVDTLRCLRGMKSMRKLTICGQSHKAIMDCLIGDVLSHDQCNLSWFRFCTKTWRAVNNPMAMALTFVQQRPTLVHCNFVPYLILPHGVTPNVAPTVNSYEVTLEQNQTGRAFLEPLRFQRISNHGIFALLLEQAFPPHTLRFQEIRPLYDGIFYMIKGLAERGVGRFGDAIGEDEKTPPRPKRKDCDGATIVQSCRKIPKVSTSLCSGK